MHVGCQWTGITLFVPAFVIAFVQFPTPIIGANIGQVHKILGILVMALVVLQVVVAHTARPDPSHRFRMVWNLFHWNLGRIVVLTAWATVFTGIYIYQDGKDALMFAVWIEPYAIVAGTLVLLDIGLSWRKACNDRDAVAAAAAAAQGQVLPPLPPLSMSRHKSTGGGYGRGDSRGSLGSLDVRVDLQMTDTLKHGSQQLQGASAHGHGYHM